MNKILRRIRPVLVEGLLRICGDIEGLLTI